MEFGCLYPRIQEASFEMLFMLIFRVITDAREWKYFKALNGIQTPVEEDMFDFDPSTSLPQVHCLKI